MRTITVTHVLGHNDLVALRRAEGPEESIQEIVERLSLAAVAQSIAKGMKGVETDQRVANGDLETGAAKEAFA